MSEDLCRGWTRADVEQLYSDASDGERRLLEAMARRPVVRGGDLQAALEDGPARAVDGFLGNVGKRAYKLNIKDTDGKVSWPFLINTDAETKEFLYLMPAQDGRSDCARQPKGCPLLRAVASSNQRSMAMTDAQPFTTAFKSLDSGPGRAFAD